MSVKKPCRKYNCCICGIECASRDIRSKSCHSKECDNAIARQRYTEKLYDKICKYCLVSYKGTSHELLCGQCKEKPRRIKFDTVVRDVLCRRCDFIIRKEIVKINHATKTTSIKGDTLCPSCLSVSRKHASEIKRGINNPNYKGLNKTRTYLKKTEEEKQLSRQRNSDRMRANNPMKNPETVQKVKNFWSINIQYRDYRKGVDHHLWKGNRLRTQTIRSRLYKTWIFPILKRDNFTCTNCGAIKCRLEVHHNSITFREILQNILEKNFNNSNLKDLTNEEFEACSNLVIEEHNNISGISLCKECHKLQDPLRR